MKRTVRAFTYVEVLLYIGLFSLLGTGLFGFAWDVLTLSKKSQTQLLLGEETRFTLEYMRGALRSATGVRVDQSRFDDTDGRLVIDIMGTSDTIIFERRQDVLMVEQSNRQPMALHDRRFRTEEITFQPNYDALGRVSSVRMRLVLGTPSGVSAEYQGSFQGATSVFLYNLGL